MTARSCRLYSRSLITVNGADAESYLGRLVTNDPVRATEGKAAHAALLTPQGKIICDFLMVRQADGFLLDCPAAGAPDLLRKLQMFRLRADVTIADVGLTRAVIVTWGDEATEGPVDGRHPGLGHRSYPEIGVAREVSADEADWQATRAGLGIAEAAIDATLGDVFPHDIAMDCLGGVDFDKGCYVGQEVVSRMRYRGTARRRPVIVRAQEALSAPGTGIIAAGRPVGTLGTASGGVAVAIVRLDKVADARNAGETITVGGMPVTVDLPDWADYGWPETTTSDS